MSNQIDMKKVIESADEYMTEQRVKGGGKQARVGKVDLSRLHQNQHQHLREHLLNEGARAVLDKYKASPRNTPGSRRGYAHA